ncbi:MAG: acyl-CoA dehydrogenase family protein [Pseudomonadales bacterium]
MPLVLNEEQRMLRDSTRDFLRDNANTQHFRALRDSDTRQACDPETWARMAELGLSAITAPEQYGGLAFGYLALGSVFEECGQLLTATPMLSSVVLSGSLIELAGNEEQKEALLPSITAGESIIASAIDEGPHHSPLATALIARQEGDQYILNGCKAFVIDGMSADKVIVLARTSGEAGEQHGLSLFVLDSVVEGLQRNRSKLVDSRDYADIELSDVAVSNSALLGNRDDAFPALDAALDRARACLAAEMLGGAQHLFDRTVAYLKEREQFGAKIGSFQALQHRAAKMYVELELTRSAVVDALSAIDEERNTSAACVSTAKCRANDTFQLIANEAVQMHGGIGVTDELDVGLYFKRCRVSLQLLGNSGFHKNRFALLNNF